MVPLLLCRMKIVLDLECLIEEHINKSASVYPYNSCNNKWISVVHKLQITELMMTAQIANVVDNGANQPKDIRITLSRTWNDVALFVNLLFYIVPIAHALIYILFFQF